MDVPPEFTTWWEKEGQFVRAGGGQYEISFAFAAWKASRREALEEAAQLIDALYPPEYRTEYAKIRAEAAAEIRTLCANPAKE